LETSGKWRLAVDVGGTFIDYIAMDESTGKVTIDKQPANAGSLVDEFITGLHRLPVPPSDLSMFIHGTTVALNTLVQERGAMTGLITTKGFRDVLELNRAGRPEIYDLRYQPATPLVPRYLRREVSERVGASGEVLTPLDLADVDEQVAFLTAHGVKAIAICLLHSYANTDHERIIAGRIREQHPDVTVSVSSELVREWREFERTSTTIINAYTQPLFANYAKSIEQRVRAEGYEHGIAFVRSNGGVMPIAAAADRPVETLNSGPAGGVIGAHALMSQTGHRNVVCADVGGTTYDVALIHDGEIVERSDTDVAGRPIMGSVIDIISVGAGGGSIASLDASSGSMRVGPESAGASPGPACFGLGGLEPTVTDAQVILNMLDPDRFLGSRMVLDRTLAENAVRHGFGENADVVALAGGIIQIAQTNMANAIRIMTTQRGLDPRDFAMLSFGGGGGLFAAGVADELGINEVIVPQAAAGFSAWGMLTADYREDSTLTSVIDVSADTAGEIVANYARLADDATAALAKYGFDPDSLTVAYSADVRYTGQDHTVTTPVSKNPAEYAADELLQEIKSGFVARHKQLYGHGDSQAAVQIVTTRCRAIAPVARPEVVGSFAESAAAVAASRDIWFPEGGWNRSVPVFNRDEMSESDTIVGPAVVDEWTTTVVIPPRWNAELDSIGNLVLTKTEDTK
jgi:N-methylhydantoinase A